MKRIISITVIIFLMLPIVSSANILLSDYALQSPGSSVSDWSAIALLVSDNNFNKAEYIMGLKQYVHNKYLTDSKLSPTKATEWHRIALAATLAGENATDFDGINLINDGVFFRENLGRQGLNAYIWALITISSGNYSEPEGALNKTEDIITHILSKQNPDGSFSLKSNSPDCDITAMAIYALSAYKSREEVMQKINDAVNYLSSAQNPDGSFSANGIPNAETTSQVIIALSSLGYDVKADLRFPMLYEALSLFQTTDGFSHSYGGTTDAIATYQGVCALIAADKKCAIYMPVASSPQPLLNKEIPTEKETEVIKAPPVEIAVTEAIEEDVTLPTIFEDAASSYSGTEASTELSVDVQSDKNQAKSFFFYIFLLILIVIILIYGILNRRKR